VTSPQIGQKACGLCGGTGWRELQSDRGHSEVIPCKCRADYAAAVERQRLHRAEGRIGYRQKVEDQQADAGEVALRRDAAELLFAQTRRWLKGEK